MGRISRDFGIWIGIVLPGICLIASPCAAQHNYSSSGGRATGGSFFSSLKPGGNKAASTASTPAGIPEPDEVSLATQAKPTPDLYTAVARFHEQTGKLSEAAQQYQKALQLDPNHLGALLGYARLKERTGETDEAARLYQQALKGHPNDASVFNNQGAFLGRRGMFQEAQAALSRAIQLQPKEAKYRNNMAVVLIEMGRPDEAFVHLRAASGSEAVAQYNLGFLLTKKGQTQAAQQRFALALRADPTMAPARAMLDRLGRPAGQPAAQVETAGRSPAPGVRMGSRPVPPVQESRPVLPSQTFRTPTAPSADPGAVRQLPPPPRPGRPAGLPEASGTPGGDALPNGWAPRRLPPTASDGAVGPELAPRGNGEAPAPPTNGRISLDGRGSGESPLLRLN